MTADHPRRIGSYDVLGVIGKGAMGAVFKAVQPSLNRVVAIKVLPEEFKGDSSRVERFDREAKAVALLNHPNVVQIIDKDEDEEHAFFVMEYVPGTSLDAIMRRRRLSLPETLSVFKQVCRGLEAAHRENVIHRDLNPRNILVSEDLSVVKITDFGISRVESISRESGTLSTNEMSMGTLHYMAPEQSVDMASTDHRSDIYSLGVLLYEMLTGRVPVGRFNLPSQINQEVPPEFDPVVLKCLATNPGERYASVSGILRHVERLEDQLRLGLIRDLRGIRASTSKIIRGSTRTLKSKKFLSIAAGASLLILSGAVLVLVLRGGAASETTSRVSVPADTALVRAMRIERYNASGTSEAQLTFPSDVPVYPVDGEAEEGAGVGGTVEPAGSQVPEVAAQIADPSTPAPAQPSAVTEASEDLDVIEAEIEVGLFGPALEDLDEFIEEHASSRLVARARLIKARVLEKQKRLEEAKAGYVEVLSRHGGEPEAAEAGYRLALALLEERGREKAREAVEVLERVAREQPGSEWAPLALARKAEAELEAKNTVTDQDLGAVVPAALATWRALVRGYPSHPEAELAWFSLAEKYEDLKQFETAAEMYLGLAEHFPNSRLDPWWKAGQIYDKKLKLKEEARRAYSQVPQSSRHYGDAQRRLRKL